ncbi:MAG TPA: BrnT family toxin [Pseudobdellovibrionaceae bacterium]|nr:BrnT family toxin [Pseudobdellovibrionaceae bacterium]
MIEFEWDNHKNQENRKKHGVWFEEEQQVFDDTNAIMFFDQDHSKSEDRFILLGLSASVRVLVVVYCERHKGKIVRIISARKATKKEMNRYEKGV